VEKNRL